MLPDPVRRLAHRLDGSYTEALVTLHRARSGTAAASTPIPAPRSNQPASGRVAVVAHVYYPELLGQLRRGIDSLPAGTDVYVSVPDETVRAETITRLGDRTAGGLDVRIVENRGRDIAPKYVAFADVYGKGYDLLLFLHTKKSLTADFGDDWRDQLFRCLAGSPETVNGIMRLFESDSGLGVVAPGHHESIGSTTGWDGNYLEARHLARRAGLKVHRWSPPDFPSGSMFWARPRALTPLTRLGLRLEEFPAEQGQVGVTIMHALERLVLVAAAQAGYHAVTVADPLAAPAPAAVIDRGGEDRVGAAAPGARLYVAAALLTTARLARAWARRASALAARSAAGRAFPARSGRQPLQRP